MITREEIHVYAATEMRSVEQACTPVEDNVIARTRRFFFELRWVIVFAWRLEMGRLYFMRDAPLSVVVAAMGWGDGKGEALDRLQAEARNEWETRMLALKNRIDAMFRELASQVIQP